jgi:hypothetical protein
MEEEAYDRLEEGDRITLSDLGNAIAASNRVRVKSEKTGFTFEARLDLSSRERKILLAGGRLNYERGASQGRHRGRHVGTLKLESEEDRGVVSEKGKKN